jgi:hypothetical protein
MLFTLENAIKVMNGKKTQTRRAVQDGDKLEWAGVPGDSPQVVISRPNDLYHRAKWQIARTYAVQPGRGKPAIGRIEITAIRRERLQAISAYDAEMEGIEVSHYYCDEGTDLDPTPMHRCDPVGKFRELWDKVNGKRPGLRWVDNPEVWVLVFRQAV